MAFTALGSREKDDYGIETAEHAASGDGEARVPQSVPWNGKDRGHEQHGAEVHDVRGAEGEIDSPRPRARSV
jgi:hypothetical protein